MSAPCARLAQIPCYLADSEGGLERVLPDTPLLMREVWLATYQDLRATTRVRAVGDGLARLVANERRLLSGRAAG
jgi:hypothetical protein